MDRRASNREYDARRNARLEYRVWYGTPQWRALRASQLGKQPLCERCQSRGTIKPANVCHHRKAHKGDEALFWDPDNLASLCANCHDVDEQRIERGGKARSDVDATGWPLDLL